MTFIYPPLKFTFKPIFELRERFERRIDRDFSNPNDDNKSDLLSRVRAGVSYNAGPVQGQIVYQYTHDELWAAPLNFSAERSDLILAYGQVKVGGGVATLGRQRLKYGGERLIGAVEWNNVSNAWDGAKFAYKGVEAFVVRSGVNPVPNRDLHLYGIAKTEKNGQSLLVFKHDTDHTEVNEATFSHVYKGAFGKLKIDAEAAGQIGHRDGKKKLAGAFDATASYAIAPKFSVAVQGSVASGGGDSKTTNTFDQLYPSGHDKHGLIDMAGWKNIRDLGLTFKYQADAVTAYKIQYHRLGLDSSHDAWYGSNGKANSGDSGKFIDPTGASGRDLGQEFDFDFSRKLNSHQTLQAGVGLFQPGNFVQALDSGSTRQQVWGYVQWGYKF